MDSLPLKFAASVPTRKEIEAQSEYCWKCWINRDEWIKRKVDQVKYLDKTTIARTLTYDIDLSRLRQLELDFSDDCDPESGCSCESDTKFMLPLDVLSRRPYMTLRLDSPWKYRSCLASSRERNWYLTMLLFGFLISIGVKFNNLTDAVIQNVAMGIRPNGDRGGRRCGAEQYVPGCESRIRQADHTGHGGDGGVASRIRLRPGRGAERRVGRPMHDKFLIQRCS